MLSWRSGGSVLRPSCHVCPGGDASLGGSHASVEIIGYLGLKLGTFGFCIKKKVTSDPLRCKGKSRTNSPGSLTVS